MPELPAADSLRHWQQWLSQRLATHTDIPTQEARWILEDLLPERNLLWTHPETTLGVSQRERLLEILARREQGDPLAYCLGRAPFLDLDLRVDPRVLIPRPDTEVLVQWALAQLPAAGPVLDFGTGSGAIILALARAHPEGEYWAVERSTEALAVAEENGKRLGLAVHWRAGDWCSGLPAGTRFSLVLSNPPYLAADDPHLPELAVEPREALVAGATGLEAFQAILTCLPGYLLPGARLGFEHGAEQGPAVRALLAAHAWQEIFTLPDLAGRERVSGGVWRGEDAGIA